MDSMSSPRNAGCHSPFFERTKFTGDMKALAVPSPIAVFSTPGTPRVGRTPVASPRAFEQGGNQVGTMQLHLVSADAAFRKERAALRKDIQILDAELARSCNKVEESTKELRKIRVAYDAKVREADFLREGYERMMEERDRLEITVKDKDYYIRKLEAKVVVQVPASQAQEKIAALNAKVASLKESNNEHKLMLRVAEDAAKALTQEVSVLKEALELKAEELSKDGDSNVQAGLLYAVSRGREDNSSLALQLARVTEELHASKQQNDKLQEQIEEQRYMEDLRGKDLLAAEKKIVELEEKLRQREAAALELQAQLARSEDERRFVSAALKETQKEVVQLRDAAEESKRKTAADLDRQRKDMELLVKLEASRGDEERARFDKELRRSAALEDELQAVRDQARAEQEAMADQLEQGKQRASMDQAEMAALRETISELRNDVANLHAEIDSLTEINLSLQEAVAQLDAKWQLEALQARNLAQQVEMLEAQQAIARSERARAESGLRVKLEEAARRLQELSDQNGSLQPQLGAVLTQNRSLEARVATLATEKTRLSAELDHLQEGKEHASSLHRMLLDQITSLQTHLDKTNAKNQELQGLVARYKSGTDRLQSLVDAENSLDESNASITASPRVLSPGQGGHYLDSHAQGGHYLNSPAHSNGDYIRSPSHAADQAADRAARGDPTHDSPSQGGDLGYPGYGPSRGDGYANSHVEASNWSAPGNSYNPGSERTPEASPRFPPHGPPGTAFGQAQGLVGAATSGGSNQGGAAVGGGGHGGPGGIGGHEGLTSAAVSGGQTWSSPSRPQAPSRQALPQQLPPQQQQQQQQQVPSGQQQAAPGQLGLTQPSGFQQAHQPARLQAEQHAPRPQLPAFSTLSRPNTAVSTPEKSQRPDSSSLRLSLGFESPSPDGAAASISHSGNEQTWRVSTDDESDHGRLSWEVSYDDPRGDSFRVATASEGGNSAAARNGVQGSPVGLGRWASQRATAGARPPLPRSSITKADSQAGDEDGDTQVVIIPMSHDTMSRPTRALSLSDIAESDPHLFSGQLIDDN